MTHLQKKALSLRLYVSFAFTVFCAVLFTPFIAWAADAVVKEQAMWQTVLMPVLSAVALFVAAFVALGLRKLVQLVEKKWGVEVPASIEDLMASKARWAIAWAEEKAEDRLLNGDGVKTPGAEKAASVIELLEGVAQKAGYGEDWQKNKIEALVAGILHLNREGGEGVIGSNGNRGTKLEEKKAANSGS
jgi:hypothetical protein